MAHPVLRHQDARLVGMPVEANAEQVVNLALEPVCARPYRCDGGNLRVRCLLVADARFQPDDGIGRQREQVIDHVVARLAFQPVYGGDVGKIVIGEGFVVA